MHGSPAQAEHGGTPDCIGGTQARSTGEAALNRQQGGFVRMRWHARGEG